MTNTHFIGKFFTALKFKTGFVSVIYACNRTLFNYYIKNKNYTILVDNSPLISYNTLVTWFEKIVKFDFVQIMALVRVIRSDFFF